MAASSPGEMEPVLVAVVLGGARVCVCVGGGGRGGSEGLGWGVPRTLQGFSRLLAAGWARRRCPWEGCPPAESTRGNLPLPHLPEQGVVPGAAALQ